MGKKQGQKEFQGMPEVSNLAKVCLKYLETKEEIEGLQEDLEKQKPEVAEQFRASGKKSIKLSGHTFIFSEFNQIKITVKKE